MEDDSLYQNAQAVNFRSRSSPGLGGRDIPDDLVEQFWAILDGMEDGEG